MILRLFKGTNILIFVHCKLRWYSIQPTIFAAKFNCKFQHDFKIYVHHNRILRF